MLAASFTFYSSKPLDKNGSHHSIIGLDAVHQIRINWLQLYFIMEKRYIREEIYLVLEKRYIKYDNLSMMRA